MADVVSTKTIEDDILYYVGVFTNVSDGTGESGVKKIDVSALSPAPKTLGIEEIWYSVSGMAVKISFDATTDDTAIVLQGDGHMDLFDIAGIRDPRSAGYTGDILFTTSGHAAADSYTIILKCRKIS